MTYSIFMAIMITSGSPAPTTAPSSTATFSMTPGIGATASLRLPPPPAALLYLGTGFSNSLEPSLVKES